MLGIRSRLEKIEVDQVLCDARRIFADDMKERIDHLRLQLGRDAADHAEIEECEASVGHHKQIARDADRHEKIRPREAV